MLSNSFKKVYCGRKSFQVNKICKGQVLDLAALTIDGDYWAIQCKCYQEKSILTNRLLIPFTPLCRRFKRRFKTVSFSHQLSGFQQQIKWGPNATQAIKTNILQYQELSSVIW
jgi:predicted helicase